MNTAAGPMLSKEPVYKQESSAHKIHWVCQISLKLVTPMIPTCPKVFVGPMTTEIPAAGLTFSITEVRAGEHSLDLLGLGLRGTNQSAQRLLTLALSASNSRTKGQINLEGNSTCFSGITKQYKSNPL